MVYNYEQYSLLQSAGIPNSIKRGFLNNKNDLCLVLSFHETICVNYTKLMTKLNFHETYICFNEDFNNITN